MARKTKQQLIREEITRKEQEIRLKRERERYSKGNRIELEEKAKRTLIKLKIDMDRYLEKSNDEKNRHGTDDDSICQVKSVVLSLVKYNNGKVELTLNNGRKYPELVRSLLLDGVFISLATGGLPDNVKEDVLRTLRKAYDGVTAKINKALDKDVINDIMKDLMRML